MRRGRGVEVVAEVLHYIVDLADDAREAVGGRVCEAALVVRALRLRGIRWCRRRHGVRRY